MTKPIMGTTAGATQLRLKFDGTTHSSEGSNIALANTRYVDVSRLLSQANHRLYRQGRMYMCRVGIHLPGAAVAFTASALPNTWMTRKAWVQGLKAARKAERESGVRKRGRWNDFRIAYDQAQYLGSSSTPVSFVSLSGATVTGNIDHVQTLIAGDSGSGEGSSASKFNFHMNGDTDFSNRGDATGSFGLIYEYDQTEDTEYDSPPHTGGSGAFDELETDSAQSGANKDLAIETGDNPPYDPDTLENARSVDYVVAQQSGDSIQPTTPWIAAPCGLLKITGYGGTLASETNLFIEVMSGNYKGVMAESM